MDHWNTGNTTICAGSHGPFSSMIDLLNMAIFHIDVKLPKGTHY